MEKLLLVVAVFFSVILIKRLFSSPPKKNTSKWEYKDYKMFVGLMDSLAIDLIEQMIKSDLSEEKIKELIGEFNSLDENSLPLTFEMVNFHKRFLEEKESRNILHRKREKLVERLKN
jgi:hypothetical protein